MKKILFLGAVLAAAATVTSVAGAANPIVPFPAPTVKQVFIAASTVMPDGTLASWFAPGSTVVFRAYAVDGKTRKIIQAKDVKYFYVTIPNQPNIKLADNATDPAATKGIPWTGKWVVPANYAAGLVNFKVLVKLNTKRLGSFVQMPVASSMLNISMTAPPAFSPASPSSGAGLVPTGKPVDLSLYVDSVNGTAPAGTSARPISCTQTNVYKRGERVVIRSWGADLNTGDVLTSDTVNEAHYSIAGQPNVVMAYSAHGAVGAQISFWSNFWIVPADYPLGETMVHVVFTTETGKTGTYDYPINIIP
jgi:hypothetical protein